MITLDYTCPRAKPVPKELKRRWSELCKGGFINRLDQASTIKQLMVESRKAGSLIAHFEMPVDAHIYNEGQPGAYSYPPGHSVYYDFYNEDDHGKLLYRVVYTKYNDELKRPDVASNYEPETLHVLVASDRERQLWMD
jgi:hypothetical protein